MLTKKRWFTRTDKAFKFFSHNWYTLDFPTTEKIGNEDGNLIRKNKTFYHNRTVDNFIHTEIKLPPIWWAYFKLLNSNDAK